MYKKTIEQLDKMRNLKAEIARYNPEMIPLGYGDMLQKLGELRVLEREAREQTTDPDEMISIIRDTQLSENDIQERGEYGRLLKAFDLTKETDYLKKVYQEESIAFKEKINELVKQYERVEQQAIEEAMQVIDKHTHKLNELVEEINIMKERNSYVHLSKMKCEDNPFTIGGVSDFFEANQDLTYAEVKHKSKYKTEMETPKGMVKHLIKELAKENK